MDIILTLGPVLATGKEFLSEAGHKMLSEQVIITGIILFALRGHFKKIEKGLSDVAKNVAEVGMSLRRVEQSHADRIAKLEVDLTHIKSRFSGS